MHIKMTNCGFSGAGRDNISLHGVTTFEGENIVSVGAGRHNFHVVAQRQFLDGTSLSGQIPPEMAQAFIAALRKEIEITKKIDASIIEKIARMVGIDRLLSERNIALATFIVTYMAWMNPGH